MFAICAALLLLAGMLGYFATSLPQASTVDVEGGIVLSRSSSELAIRCTSPSLKITLERFSGKVILMNCANGAIIEGTKCENGTLKFDVKTDAKKTYEVRAPCDNETTFAVLGDSQGNNHVLAKALDSINGKNAEFIIHCGDLTPSGRAGEYDAFEATINGSKAPVYMTMGNHDVKNGGEKEYVKRFSPTRYSFVHEGLAFAFIDSSDLSITDEELTWLSSAFSSKRMAGASAKIIVTHVPSLDPSGGNHTLDVASCDRLQEYARKNGIAAIFSGHIHMYDQRTVDNTDYVITGGAGATMESGTHSYVLVKYSNGKFTYDCVPIIAEPQEGENVTIIRNNKTVILTYVDLFSLEQLEGNSSYENQFGNVGGAGTYKGIEFSVLLSYVGGMNKSERVNVYSSDGYLQTFGYLNIYPNETWLSRQGKMLLAIEYSSERVPSWQDGPRVAMLPSDGLYSNSDCENTSYPGEGYFLYPSAGARWSKCVVRIEVCQ